MAPSHEDRLSRSVPALGVVPEASRCVQPGRVRDAHRKKVARSKHQHLADLSAVDDGLAAIVLLLAPPWTST